QRAQLRGDARVHSRCARAQLRGDAAQYLRRRPRALRRRHSIVPARTRLKRGKTMSRESILAALSAANVRKHVEHITTTMPTRLAGSANAKRMAEYSLEQLRAAGATAQMHELPGLVSFP